MSRVLLSLLALVFVAPIWLMFSGSFLRNAHMFLNPPPIFPANPTVDSYLWAVQLPGFAGWALNTVLVAVSVAVLTIGVTVLCAYAFSVYQFRGKRWLWPCLLLGVMIPRIALIIPLFVVVTKLGLYSTVLAVILPLVYYPVGIFFSRAFFDTVPRSLIESARIDGAGELSILFRIVLPMSKPLVTTLGLFSAIGALQDWVWQNLQLIDPEKTTLLVGLLQATMQRSIGGNDVNPLGHSMASGVILLVPLVVIFAVANKYFTGSLSGALKE